MVEVIWYLLFHRSPHPRLLPLVSSYFLPPWRINLFEIELAGKSKKMDWSREVKQVRWKGVRSSRALRSVKFEVRRAEITMSADRATCRHVRTKMYEVITIRIIR